VGLPREQEDTKKSTGLSLAAVTEAAWSCLQNKGMIEEKEESKGFAGEDSEVKEVTDASPSSQRKKVRLLTQERKTFLCFQVANSCQHLLSVGPRAKSMQP
jgi:hypothetical protein